MKQKMIGLLFIAVFLPLCVSCVKSDDPVKRREQACAKLLKKQKLVRIAVAGPCKTSPELMNGIQLAYDEINASGGVLGAKLDLVSYDDENNIATGGQVAYEIANDEATCAVLGHYSSTLSLSNSILYHFYGLPMFSPMSTSPKLMKRGLPLVFRNLPSDEIFAETLVRFCNSNGWNKVMIYYMAGAYGDGFANEFELRCDRYNIFVLNRERYERGELVSTHYAVAKNWLENYVFDAVFIAGDMPELADVISSFRAAGIKTPILSGLTLDSPIFFDYAENNHEVDAYVPSNFDDESDYPAYKKFAEAYTARYGYAPDWRAMQGYDALKVLAKAIDKAGSVRGEDIAAALHSTTWEEAAGPYNFDETGDLIGRQLIIKRIDPEKRIFKKISE